MHITIPSGIMITHVRVSNFRSLKDVEVPLNDLTLLIGSNNAGKTSFLDALYSAIGAGRKTWGQDDIRLARGEALPPKDRLVTVDIKIRPVGDDGALADTFPPGSFWTALWGSGIAIDEADDFREFMAFRTTLAWSATKADYVVERKFLKEWLPANKWLDAKTIEQKLSAAQIDPIALHYIDAKRDLEDDLRRPGSFWRRMTEDLGLSAADVDAFETALTNLNQNLVAKSEILKHLKENLAEMQSVVSADSAGVDIAPVARKLRDLSKGVDVTFSTAGAQSFPLARHGMGTRSLASLLVFRAFASWREQQAQKEGDLIHILLALEEPEAHLHPQAQRSLFSRIKSIPGQRIVSTHSPYFAGQAKLADLRLFIKSDGDTVVTALDLSKLTKADDLRKLQHSVVDTRGDLLFANAVVFFEGETEEHALPIWAEEYWGATIHELGFSFVRVGGASNYFPFIWLAESLEIPWYVLGDGETKPVSDLNAALHKSGKPASNACPNVVVMPNGNNFESQLIADGYLPEIESALNGTHDVKAFLDDFIAENHGKSRGKDKPARDYKCADGREIAALDALKKLKTRMAEPLATMISQLADDSRRFPPQIRKLFDIIATEQSRPKATEPVATAAAAAPATEIA